MRLGLIINPMAGVGGCVGLKGSDGPDVQRRALALGAVPRAGDRTVRALRRLASPGSDIDFFTCPGNMGADAVLLSGFAPRPIQTAVFPTSVATTRDHTREAATVLKRMGMDLILFAGGDGTARDIFDAIGHDYPVLGIPAGVKMHSAVYGATPEKSGDLAAAFLSRRCTRLRHREVLDLDEEALRRGRVAPSLYGYLLVPEERRFLQGLKTPTSPSEAAAQAAIAERIVAGMEPEQLYIIGPGTTTQAILTRLGLDGTLIGVDVVKDRRLLVKDANEADLLQCLGSAPATIVVTLIGGQGFVFGRGNQQISPAVIRAAGPQHLIIVAAPGKIYDLKGQPVLVDTGDTELDSRIAGFVPIVTGMDECIYYPAA